MHDLDLSGLNQLEESFRAYLRKLCESEQRLENKGLSITTRNAVVSQRRLEVFAHNTWRMLTLPQSIIINKVVSPTSSVFQIKGPLVVKGFITQPHIILLAHLIYRVQFRDQNGDLSEHEFTLGWTAIPPEVQPNGDNIAENKIKVKLQTGPGKTLLGDLVWDF